MPGTNVVIPFQPGFYRDAFSPWLDWNATKPEERWKAFFYARVQEPADAKKYGTSWLYTSSDGIHWNQRDKVEANVGDNTTIFYNPFRKKWVMSVRRHAPERGRHVGGRCEPRFGSCQWYGLASRGDQGPWCLHNL